MIGSTAKRRIPRLIHLILERSPEVEVCGLALLLVKTT